MLRSDLFTTVFVLACVNTQFESQGSIPLRAVHSTVFPPHHPRKGADSQIACEPVYEPHPGPKDRQIHARGGEFINRSAGEM